MQLTSITPGQAGQFIVRVYEAGHSAGSLMRGIKLSRASVETLPPVARTIFGHHSGGTQFRDFHWWKAPALTPSVVAASLTSSQSIDVVMPPTLIDNSSTLQEQFVKGRGRSYSLQFVSMGKDESETAFHARATAMIIGYQKVSGKSAAEMAQLLSGDNYDVTEGNYTSYIRPDRARFPAHLIWRFCKYTGYALDGVPATGLEPVKKTKRKRLFELTRRRTGMD